MTKHLLCLFFPLSVLSQNRPVKQHPGLLGTEGFSTSSLQLSVLFENPYGKTHILLSGGIESTREKEKLAVTSLHFLRDDLSKAKGTLFLVGASVSSGITFQAGPGYRQGSFLVALLGRANVDNGVKRSPVALYFAVAPLRGTRRE